MKKLRKVNTSKRKRDRKKAQDRLAQRTAMMLSHPTECCACETPFVRSHDTVKSWNVTINESRIRLTCPGCWRQLEDALEKLK